MTASPSEQSWLGAEDGQSSENDERERDLAERLGRVQALMVREQLDVCFLSNPANFRYLTALESDFLLSPTRPWFLVIPAVGNPIAVIPELGAELVEKAWPTLDVRTWPSPRPHDEGVTAALEALREVGGQTCALGVESGSETRLGMPVSDFDRLRRELPGEWLVRDCGGILQEARMVKTSREATRVGKACAAASEAFDAITTFIREGSTEIEIARQFMLLGLTYGAQRCPYLAFARGRGGYGVPLASPRDERVEAGDVMTIDVGFSVDGYFCDFNRNWAIDPQDRTANDAYRVLYDATEKGLEAVRPGVTASAVWHVMARELEPHGVLASSARMGHGLGLDITEPPSISSTDTTEIKPGMVLTIEPSIVLGSGLLMVHEEVVLIESTGARLLSSRSSFDLPQIQWKAGQA